MRFKKGDKVVCIRKHEWCRTSIGPKCNDIVTVTEAYVSKRDGDTYLIIGEHLLHQDGTRQGFIASEFRHLKPKRFTNSLTAKLAKEAEENTQERREQPQRKPQTV